MASDVVLAERLRSLWPHLNERQRRLLVGAEARSLGRGGISRVAAAAGVSVPTVRKGVAELADGSPAPVGRSRRSGAGRKKATVADVGLAGALEALVSPDTRGDPESLLRWTCKSTRQLADELTRQGHRVGRVTVGELLHELGYSLQANAKVLEGTQHPDRDHQFRYINECASEHIAYGQPVISVDTKKKELVGAYANKGRELQPVGRPEQVGTYDFPGTGGKAIPYGVYDVAANTGWVSVGSDHDTAEFAVTTIGRWWAITGRDAYPDAEWLLVCADGGGSNSSRGKAWKAELAGLAARTGLHITVCHFPPGTSKWNKIEHRLFSHISMNWRGKPLTSHEVVVELIAATTTRTGLTVHAELDNSTYATAVQVSKHDFAAIPISRHTFHPDWNYTLAPTRTSAT